MPRFICFTCLTVFVMTSPAFAQQMQQMEDVIHLKNGGLIRGVIIEEIVGESLKIQTRDGNVFVYAMDEIAKMSREPVMGRRGEIGVQKKDPNIAMGLSLFLPGSGQFYNGQYRKGVTLFGAIILGIALARSGFEDNYYEYTNNFGYITETKVDPDDDDWKIGPGLIIFFGSWLGAMYDAGKSADTINRQNQHSSYGHLIELGGSRTTLGVDPVVSPKNVGTRLTLHF